MFSRYSGPPVAVVSGKPDLLKRVPQPVDTPSMIDFELEDLRRDEQWRHVLTAYRNRCEAAARENPEADGWLLRLDGIEEVAVEELPRIHGKLIALGFLKFELAGRTEGMRYQVTTAGRQALERGIGTSDDE